MPKGLEVSRRERDGVIIFMLRGRVMLRDGVEVLRATLMPEVVKGTNLLVDMGGVGLMESSGVGELVAAAKALRSRGGDLKLLHLPARLAEVLERTRLTTLFEVFDDEEAALRSFQRGPAGS